MQNFIVPRTKAVTLNDGAVSHFNNIAANKVVKLGLEGGSCAGHKYQWQIFDDIDNLYPDDEITKYENFIFAVDGASILFLVGSQVDYTSGIFGSKIEINNPNTKASCGCGESINFG